MIIKSKKESSLSSILSEDTIIKTDIKSELRKEINGYKRLYLNSKYDILKWEEMNDISIRSSKITVSQLNDCVCFMINEQLSRERLMAVLNT